MTLDVECFRFDGGNHETTFTVASNAHPTVRFTTPSTQPLRPRRHRSGGCLLALSQPAEAKIVYTKTNTLITNGTILALDNDKKPDFLFVFHTTWYGSTGGGYLGLHGAASRWDQIWGIGKWASALPSGAVIGPRHNKFTPKHYEMLYWWNSWDGYRSGGPWLKVGTAYLGLKFKIEGEVHYGWARVNTTDHASNYLTGYAYETIPNKPIITGKTKGRDVITIEPGSLGALAAGNR